MDGQLPKQRAGERAQHQQREKDAARRAAAVADHGKDEFADEQNDDEPQRVFAVQKRFDHAVAAAQHLRQKQPEQAGKGERDHHFYRLRKGQLCIETLAEEQRFVVKSAE